MSTESFREKVIAHGLDNLEAQSEGVEAADLHHHLFNEYYFVIGYGNACEYLEEYGTMAAVRRVQEYETENFGEVSADLGDSEKVCNMLAYIIGEEWLADSKVLERCWNRKLWDDDLAELKEELAQEVTA